MHPGALDAYPVGAPDEHGPPVDASASGTGGLCLAAVSQAIRRMARRRFCERSVAFWRRRIPASIIVAAVRGPKAPVGRYVLPAAWLYETKKWVISSTRLCGSSFRRRKPAYSVDFVATAM